jgi:NADH-quinone oxidoreductase subunit H
MLVVVVAVLIGVAYLTLLERKVLGSMQLRVGPQTVGVWGVLQPFADAVKLLVKESILPNHANRVIFLLAPMLSLVLALAS